MCEIKYRVWSKKQKTYNYKHPFNTHGYFYISQNGILFSDYGNVITPEIKQDDFVIERYAGIKDQDDKEIYAGDIVSVYEGRYVGYIVQHSSGEWRIIWVSPQGTEDSLYSHRTICEVVGNIHENPELLKEKKK